MSDFAFICILVAWCAAILFLCIPFPSLYMRLVTYWQNTRRRYASLLAIEKHLESESRLSTDETLSTLPTRDRLDGRTVSLKS